MVKKIQRIITNHSHQTNERYKLHCSTIVWQPYENQQKANFTSNLYHPTFKVMLIIIPEKNMYNFV